MFGGTVTIAERLLHELLRDRVNGPGGLVTWFNHYSILVALQNGLPTSDFTHIGVDGTLLLRLLSKDGTRTSADLTVPKVLLGKSLTVGLIGGSLEMAKSHAESFQSKFPLCTVTWSLDGYSGIPVALATLKSMPIPDIILVGLGAFVQEQVSSAIWAEASVKDKGTLVMTCGGWLDQLTIHEYYPAWAYPLKLNWLVRLAREPVRLWRRYSLEAIRAIWMRRNIRNFVKENAENWIF